MQKHNIACGRISCILVVTISIASSLLIQNVYAFTYESQDWWFAQEQQEDEPTAELGIIFTYPDRVIENDTIDVNVRIEYMDNEDAQAEYAILDDVTIHVRDNKTRLDGDIYSSNGNERSPVLRPGEIFNHTYSIPTQDNRLQPGNFYAIDLSFTVVFSMKTKIETYYWDSGEKFGYSIEPQELKPFELVARNNTQGNELTLRINRPFGLFEPISIRIDDQIFDVEGGARTIVLGPNSIANITIIDETIPFLGHEKLMRAKFASWSDGDKRPEREVDLNKNTELFAIYTTQYYLNATTEVPPNAPTIPSAIYLNNTVEGEGWKDAGSEVEFSVRNLGTDWSFDHWTGDIGSNIDRSSPSNSVIMDGPKTVQAQLRPNDIAQGFAENKDLLNGVIASAIIGPLAGLGLSVLYSSMEKKRNLVYMNTYIPMINDMLRQNINEKDRFKELVLIRNEIIRSLQAGIINTETFRVLDDRIIEGFEGKFDISQE